MKRKSRLFRWLPVLALACATACSGGASGCSQTYVTEHDEVNPSKEKYDVFADDKAEDKNPAFDSALVDRRTFGDNPENRWEINASGAVIGLDILDIRDSDEQHLLKLYPSYGDAVTALRKQGVAVLPSINLIDGKAKQFDDGLYAALDHWMADSEGNGVGGVAELVLAIVDGMDRNSDAAAWLCGALQVGGYLEGNPPSKTARFVEDFEADGLLSKPIGFYTWSEELKRTFRFFRFLQQPFTTGKGIPGDIAAVLEKDEALRQRYEKMIGFYARLTNPMNAANFGHLADPANRAVSLPALAEKLGYEKATVHFLPSSTSKEVVLFNRLFPFGLPADADLMMELVQAVRDGRVDLKPDADSGWYEHQVYALETFLLPSRGKESGKLALTKKYKERMLQAFQALITKRRETHVRQLDGAVGSAAPPSEPEGLLSPRLRMEPNPTFYLRTARAYAFLQNFLAAVMPEGELARLHGLKQGGERAENLEAELERMKNLFYGLHLLCCEDIGMRPDLRPDELADPASCEAVAEEWLKGWAEDGDLGADTRVSVPIYVDPNRGVTRLWATLGIRGAKLEAVYEKQPKWRPLAREGEEAGGWQQMQPWDCQNAVYVILVDEFAEIELKGIRSLTREELRKVCDAHETKEEIVDALSK